MPAGPTIPARSLVIPMFDEGSRIGATVRTLEASGIVDENVEILLVDDGSSDGTPEVAEAALASAGFVHWQVLRQPENRGKGAAVRAGMLAAQGRSRVFVDADLCVDPADISRCFDQLEDQGSDVVYGTRAHPGSELHRNQPVHRVLSGRTFNLLLRSLGLTSERDTQCGLKGFSGTAATEIFSRLTTERFAFDVEVLARAGRSGLQVTPLPVQWSHVEASRVRPVRDGIDMARAAVRIRRQLDREAGGSGVGGAGPMEADAITAMATVERTHWWFRAKRNLVLAELDRHDAVGTVVDVGAGTGGLLDALWAAGRPAVGVELDEEALRLSTRFEPRPILAQAVAEAIPIAGGATGAVTSLDVIEHLDDDVAGFRELARVAGPGGLVIVAVPAYQWAWSDHDVRLGHRRRYTRRPLAEAARAAGIDVERCTHFHSWLAPVAFLVRRTPLRRLVDGDKAEEASFVSPFVNRVISGVVAAERRLLGIVDLPVGLSILLVGRVSDDRDAALDRGDPTT
ncbi:glycosyltransferase [Actinospongicola halichondriae]|uniref:glycosyltransferase n=1 Tax=Actinospongicola halichondriae TaxID=3236844 RepID=UPI003D5A37E0